MLALLSVVVVGAVIIVVVVNPPINGEGAGRPAHPQDRTTRAHDPVTVEPLVEGSAEPDEPTPKPGRPRRVIIESLDIRAPVVPLEASGSTLHPPDDAAKVGWWRDGALPGAVRGSAVFTGHTVTNGDGVFDDLERLRVRDRVRMVTDNGVLQYVVSAEASYRRTALAHRAPQLFSQSSAGRLVLVTCEDWNGESYLSNHVVIATPGSPMARGRTGRERHQSPGHGQAVQRP